MAVLLGGTLVLLLLWFALHYHWAGLDAPAAEDEIWALILTLFVVCFLARVFDGQVRRNVFQAVFGYFLPEPVEKSLYLLVRTEFVAENEHFIVRLEPRNGDGILVRIQQSALLHNVGPAMRRIPLRVSVGNTNSGKSKVEELSWAGRNNASSQEMPPPSISESEASTRAHRLVTIERSGAADLGYAAVLRREKTDAVQIMSGYWSVEPKVTCLESDRPAGTTVRVDFGVAGPHEVRHPVAGVHLLLGTLAPRQVIRISWQAP